MRRVQARKQNDDAQRKENIRRAIQARRENPKLGLREAELLFGIPKLTISNREREATKNRRTAHKHQQKLPPPIERALVKWVEQLNEWGFPPRIDILKGIAAAFAAKCSKEEGDPSLASFGEKLARTFS
ncbi:hypothetical protein RUND412_011039 [Rhizina undulata]